MNGAAVVQAAVATALVVAMPVWDRLETRRLKRSTGTGAKVASYQRVMGVLWGLTAILLVTGPASGWLRAPEAAARLTARVGWGPVRGVVIGLAIGLALPVVIGLVRPEARRRMAQPLEAHAWFLPSSRRERAWFAAVAVSAGVCEELLYRGFLIQWLGAWGLGPALSVVLAAVAFLLAHTYQGAVGALAAGVLALVFTLLYFLSGSLLLPIVVHVLLDLRVLVLWPRGGLRALRSS